MHAVQRRSCWLAAALTLSVTIGVGAAGAHAISVDSITPQGYSDPGVDDAGLRIYLSDPELGLIGRFRQGDEVIYFEARRTIDAETGAPAAMTLRLLDREARLLAHAGHPDGTFADAGGSSRPTGEQAAVLAAFADELDQLSLHAAMSAEKSTLVGLAQAGSDPAVRFPYTLELSEAAGRAVDARTVADFYLGALADVRMQRDLGGLLRVDLGNGLEFESRHRFLPFEQNEHGELGRYDGYSRVVNGHGEHLSSELGGDSPPAEWTNLHAETELRPRSHDELATEAGRAAMALNGMSVVGRNARGVSFGNDLELDVMSRLARSLSAELLPISEFDLASATQAKSTGRYRTNLQVHRKSLVVIAEHSATRVLRYFYTSTTSNVISSSSTINYCNHGACPGGSGMSRKCTYTGPRTSAYRTPPKHGGDGTCNTAYSLAGDSTAPIWNLWFNHNCHDDSSVQLRVVKGQSYGVRSGRCADGPLFWAHAPNC